MIKLMTVFCVHIFNMGLRTKTWLIAISGYPLLLPPAQAHVICTKALDHCLVIKHLGMSLYCVDLNSSSI
jgi:hypothetical protein